nr:Transcriptional activator NphR [Virgibacillus halodenitrificans]
MIYKKFLVYRGGFEMDMLIIDRDSTERLGIEWFIKSNQLPIKQVYHAETIQQANVLLTKKQPDLVVIELEMLSRDKMKAFTRNIFRFSKTIISVTAEPLFERALQSIELQSSSLLVKPFNLNLLKKALIEATKIDHRQLPDSMRISRNQEIYHSLFIKTALVDPIKPFFLLFQPEVNELNNNLHQWLSEIKLPFEKEIYPLSSMVVCLAYPHETDGLEFIKLEAYKMLDWWEESFHSNINIAIHDSHINNDNLQQAYITAKNALNMKFYKGFKQLFHTSDLPVFQSIDPFLTTSEQRFWMESLEKGDIEKIKEYLYQSFNKSYENYPDPELVRIQLTSILAQIRRFIKNYKLTKTVEIETEYHRMFDIILNSPILYSIVQELILFCIKVINNSRIQKEKRDFSYLERSLFYIENNFSEPDLCLEDLADYLEISPNYLSYLLSSARHPFKKMVNEMRVKDATRLLIETDEPIQKISSIAGFKDPNYFSRIFKKYMNSTPNEYRKQK